MAKQILCPFCGQTGVRSDEHVWAQWMHTTVGAVQLLEGTHGERIDLEQSRLRRDTDGRYRYETFVSGRTSTWLPNVKVQVCADCNNGWMSSLEQAVKDILGPFILDGAPHLRLSAADLRTLATWATKSWMAYALLRPTHANPFTAADYGAMAAEPQPLTRSTVWMMHSTDPGAHVAMDLNSTLMTPEDEGTHGLPDLSVEQDNLAYGILSVATVVFVLQVVPDDAPEGMAEAFAPPTLASPRTARRIWPDLRPQYFPLTTTPPGLLAQTQQYPSQLFDMLGLPAVGLNNDDAEKVLREFRDGAEPRELRRK